MALLATSAMAAEPVELKRNSQFVVTGSDYSSILINKYVQDLGDPKLAEQAYVDAWRKNPNNPEYFARAVKAYMVFGEIDNVVKISDKVKPDILSSDAKVVLANEAFANKKYKKVQKLLSDVATTDIHGAYAQQLKMWSKAKTSGLNKALEISKDKTGIDYIDKNIIYTKALLYQYFGDDNNALKYYDEAYKSDAFSYNGVTAYAQLLAKNNRPKEALDVLKRAGEQTSDEALYKIEADKIMKYSQNTADKDNKNFPQFAANAMGIIAQAIASDNSNGSPLSEFAMAKKIDNNLHILDMQAAQTQVSFGLKDEAEKTLEQIPTNSEFGGRSSAILASLVYDSDKEKGEKLGEESVKYYPTPINQASLASLYLNSQKYDKAVTLYNNAIKDSLNGNNDLDDDLWRIYFGRANAYIGLEKWNEAIEDLRIANKLNPDNPSLLNSLGYLLADRGTTKKDLNEARDLLQKAVLIRPTSGETIDSYGWLLFRMGKYKDALDFLEKAMELSPNVADIAEHLGDAYYQTGRKYEALLEWQKAEDLFDKQIDKDRVKKKLEALKAEIDNLQKFDNKNIRNKKII